MEEQMQPKELLQPEIVAIRTDQDLRTWEAFQQAVHKPKWTDPKTLGSNIDEVSINGQLLSIG